MFSQLSRDTKRGFGLLGTSIAGFLLLWFLAAFVPSTSETTAKNIASASSLPVVLSSSRTALLRAFASSREKKGRHEVNS